MTAFGYLRQNYFLINSKIRIIEYISYWNSNVCYQLCEFFEFEHPSQVDLANKLVQFVFS